MAPSVQRLAVATRPTLGTVFARAARLRCPACGVDRLYRRRFVMGRACGTCGLVYEVEQGFFVGAIYVNYAVTAGIGLGSVLLLDRLRPLSLTAQLAIAIPLMLIVPVLFFHHARSFWLAINYYATAGERRPPRTQ